MPGMVPSSAVVAAASMPDFVLADADVAEMLAPLAQFTSPARFQMLLFDLLSCPDALEALKRKHACLSWLRPDSASVARLNHAVARTCAERRKAGAELRAYCERISAMVRRVRADFAAVQARR